MSFKYKQIRELSAGNNASVNLVAKKDENDKNDER
jgi:hypothetical protein